jgi:histidinol-phosphate aminotransferase
VTTTDPTRLLRLAGPVEPYPAEPSDAELASHLGLDLSQIVRFDMNTLGGGPLPGVAAALRSYDPATVVEYGDLAYVRLRAAISAVIGVDPARIIPGAGADELIRLVTGMTVGDGDRVVIPTPTFAMYAVEARLAGAEVVEVPRTAPNQRQPIAEIRAAVESSGARLVWLCAPNNPTGDGFTVDEVRALAVDLPALVVVDAVYQEFAEASAALPPESLSLAGLQQQVPNLMVLRSLAKAYGLAGARVGYLLVADGLADRFAAARLPLPIGGPSEAAALGALADPAEARRRHAMIVAERERLARGLAAMGWRVLPSVANFLLVQPPDAHRVAAALLKRGLVVRGYPDGPLGAWLRITVRAADENDRLLATLGSSG